MAVIPVVHTAICGARGHVTWKNADPARRPYRDFDAVFFICLLGFPLVPFRAAHVFRHTVWNFVREYEWHPIRWSFALVARAWLRRASLMAMLYAVPFLGFALMAIVAKNDPNGWTLLNFCVAAIILCPVVWWLLGKRDQRNRDIRRVIGNWRLGSGDPWTFAPAWAADNDLHAKPLYGTDMFAEGALNCMKNHNWWGAMFAARMCMLLEDRRLGEELTATILAEPEVQDGIAAVRANPDEWHVLLGPGRYESA
jgi:hypothetical protein